MSEHCVKGMCIAGLTGSTPINVEDWERAVDEFEKVIEVWNVKTRRFAIPHPGFVHKSNFCVKCGRKV